MTARRRVALGAAVALGLASAWLLARGWGRADGAPTAAAAPAAPATTPASGAPAATAASGARPGAARARRVSSSARDALARLIEELRAKRHSAAAGAADAGAAPREPSDEELDTVYIAEVLDELSAHVGACYSAARALAPEAGGSLDLELTIEGEPDAGAVLADLRVVESSVTDPAFAACLLDTTRTLAFPAPLLGGRAVVRHGWSFATHLRPDGVRIVTTSAMTTRP